MTTIGIVIGFIVLEIVVVIALAYMLHTYPKELGSCPSRWRKGW